jgi:hypothetical protein
VVFTAVLVLMSIVAACRGLLSHNPDERYARPLDDRTSFIKSRSQTNLDGANPELAALGATARGESRLESRVESRLEKHHVDGRDSAAPSTLGGTLNGINGVEERMNGSVASGFDGSGQKSYAADWRPAKRGSPTQI